MCRYYFGGFYGDYESPINDNPKEIKKRIKAHIEREHRYDLSKTLDEIRPSYRFDVSVLITYSVKKPSSERKAVFLLS